MFKSWDICAVQDHAQVLEVWQRLLEHPVTTLAASSLRGQLLSMLSMLVDAVASGKAAELGITATAAATAVLRLVEFNPNINRWEEGPGLSVQCL
jgi:hypothetical protein